MPRNDLILFLDCEMTGNIFDPTHGVFDDELVEIGVSALIEPTWKEVDSFTAVIQPSKAAYDRMLAHPVVGPMLTDNGLVADIDAGLGQHPEIVDARLVAWLDGRSNSKNKKSHTPFGGSGVAHFDRKYIDYYLPRFSARITFWEYDVGGYRRLWNLAGAPWTDAYEAKTHRALDDARAHAEEFRYALDFVHQAAVANGLG